MTPAPTPTTTPSAEDSFYRRACRRRDRPRPGPRRTADRPRTVVGCGWWPATAPRPARPGTTLRPAAPGDQPVPALTCEVSSCRFDTLSLWNAFDRCHSTVLVVTYRSCAIWELVRC